jgi:hypothetical protein
MPNDSAGSLSLRTKKPHWPLLLVCAVDFLYFTNNKYVLHIN